MLVYFNQCNFLRKIVRQIIHDRNIFWFKEPWSGFAVLRLNLRIPQSVVQHNLPQQQGQS